MSIYLNCLDNGITLNKKNYLMRAAQRLNLDIFKERNNFTLTPEYVLNIEPYDPFVKGSKWTGIWEIDLLIDRAACGPYWHAADDIFVAISTFTKRLEGKHDDKINLLFQACDPGLHKKQKVEEKYDIVFAGSGGPTYYSERDRISGMLMDKYECMDYGKGVPAVEYVNRLSQAKVQFIRSMNTSIADGELAQRFFECLAIGPVLTNHVDDLKYTGLIEGVDYYSYRDDDEMIAKLDHLLIDEEFAHKMAANGRKKALMLHTYEHRLMSILQVVKDHDLSNNSSMGSK